jgi:transposase-like protein
MRYPASKYDRLTHLILDDVEGTELSLKEIAKKHGVSTAFVANRLSQYGIKHGRRPAATLKASQVESILADSQMGTPVAELAEKYGVSRSHIYYLRRTHIGERIEQKAKPVSEHSCYSHIKCRTSSAQMAMKTASFFGMQTATFVGEAIEHYINHLNS